MKDDSYEPTQTDILLQIAQTLAKVQAQASQSADTGGMLDKMTATLAELATRSRPENPETAAISAYSYPEGDKAHPKAPLKCDMYWVGYPMTIETLRPDEVDALNRLEPGDYFVTKGNGIRIPFTVAGKRKQNGDLSELWISFPCKDDQKTDHRTLVEYCREAMGEKIPTLLELETELAVLRAKLAGAAA